MHGHEPHSSSPEPDVVDQTSASPKVGLILFFIYAVVYAGFVLINTFAPEWMEITPWAGINVAILYGFGLILFATLLAALYGWLFRAGRTSRNG